MNDLLLKLSPNNRMQSLQIVSSFPEYNELIQRAVTILLLSNEKTYWVNDEPLYTLLEKSNSRGLDDLEAAVAGMGKYLKSDLEDGYGELESVELSLTSENGTQKITINITRVDQTIITGEVAL